MQPINALSFDCYGTLVNWEAGILAAFTDLWPEARPEDSELLETFARHESRLEAQVPILAYIDVLRGVARGVADDFGLPMDDGLADAFAASIADWPLFPDVLPTLEALATDYRLVILSNVDKVSFAGTCARLGHVIDAALIAEETGAYKPDPAAFAALKTHMDEHAISAGEILHVAQSLYHDHGPAAQAGLHTCWVDRRADVEGWGAVLPPEGEVQPEYRIRSLAELPGVIDDIAGSVATASG